MDWRIWLGATGATVILAVGTTNSTPSVEVDVAQDRVAAGGDGELHDATKNADKGQGEPLAAAGRKGESDRKPAGQPAVEETEVVDVEIANYRISGVVVDEWDRPVFGASILIGPLMQPLNDFGKTDVEGRFNAEWSGGEGTMEVALATAQNGLADNGMAVVEVRAGKPLELRIAARHVFVGGPVALGRTDMNKAHSQEELVALKEELHRRHEHRSRAVDRYLPRLQVYRPKDGITGFYWPVDNLAIEDAFEVEEVGEEPGGRKRRAGSGRQSGGFFFDDVTQGEENPVMLTGLVTDGAGNSVGGVPVRVWVSRAERGSGADQFRTWTDEDGSFELPTAHGVEALSMFAGGGDYGIARNEIAIDVEKKQSRVHWDAVLDRGREVHGAVEGEESGAFDGWIVEYHSAQSGWMDGTEIKDGAFALPNLPSGRGQLHLRQNLFEVLPRLVLESAHPSVGGDAMAIEAVDPGVGSLRVALADEHGEVVSGADVRVWQHASNRAVRMQFDKKARQYVRRGLPAGRYRVVAGNISNGYRDLGEVEIVAAEESNLGSAVLMSTGTLAFGPFEEAEGWTLSRLTKGLETFADFGEGDLSFNGQVPAGEYVLHITMADGTQTEESFEVRAGEETELGQ